MFKIYTNSSCSRHLEPEVQNICKKMFAIIMQQNSENTRSITKQTRLVREKTCFGQNQGYPYKMAENSAILKVIIRKLCSSIDGTSVNVNPNSEHFRSKNVIFVNFSVFFWKQNGRQSRHLEIDFDQKQ